MTADERTMIQGHEPTILMPMPGGQATVVMKRAAARRTTSPGPGVDLQRLVAGINPLLGAAATLLGLITQLRSTTSHDDPVGLRRQLLEWIAEFEAMAAANGVPRPKITAARYLLCSFIDEAIAQTPWATGASERTLLQEFHEERSGGEKAFQLLERLGQDPATNADLLELFYVCLQLGFEGRYRGVPNGRAQLDAIAERVLDVIRPARDSAAARTLAVHWQGVATRGHRDVSALPPWVLLALAAAIVLAMFLLLNSRLEALAQPVFRQIHAVPAALQATRDEMAAKPRLAPLLQPEIARNSLLVRDDVLRSVVTLPADPLFVAGSAQIDAGQHALLKRVALALKDTPGQIAVIGHTDNAPVSSLQFPSHWHLSRERAQAVLSLLAEQGVRPDRMRAEGRADAEPLFANPSAAERARNRRIEIELRLPRPDG
ncbi:MAG TPA: type IVB secretion system protein IcmH/DotU [Albitalea sp.]|jgi:type VI secretion system protein ImpK|nr:type IVB secretion system protein IcmH/DotU [Albitalea sp.]